MLRTILLAGAAAFFATAASAEDFPSNMPVSAVDMAVVADDGSIVGRVEGVERNARGEIVAVSMEGLEAPGDAPSSAPLVAERDRTPMAQLPPLSRDVRLAEADGGRRMR